MRITGQATALPVAEMKELAEEIKAYIGGSNVHAATTTHKLGPQKRKYSVTWSEQNDVIDVTSMQSI